MSHNEWSAALFADERRRQAAMLAEAKEAALKRGKEPFDLAKVEAIYARFSPPWNASDEEKTRVWEHTYYVTNRRVLTLEEFAEVAWLNDVYDGA